MLVRSFALLLILLVCIPARATQLPGETNANRDLWHTMQARKLLLDDIELGALNVGVRVRNRIATLWGPVPTAELAFKAEIRLRALIELTEVRNELFVTNESIPAPAEPRQVAPTPLFLPGQLPPALPQAESAPKGTRTTNKPPPAELPDQEIELPALRLPGTGPALEPVRRLGDSVEALLRANEAYRPIRYTIRDQSVYLLGTGANPNHVQEFARAVARLPGVAGVVLEDPSRRR